MGRTYRRGAAGPGRACGAGRVVRVRVVDVMPGRKQGRSATSPAGQGEATPLVPLDPAAFATTYSTEQLLTTLYLENMQLKREHRPEFERTEVELPSPDVVASDPAYEHVRRYLEHDPADGPRFLVLANEYPAVGAEYGNGFVHRRVKAYQALGARVDVIAFGRRRPRKVYEYDGVRVLSGYGHELMGLLAARSYTSVSVHFLNPTMWNVIYPARHRTRFVFFLHGYEVDRFVRREFEQRTDEALRLAVARSLSLQAFWAQVTRDLELQADFVLVSQWWRRLVEEDMEVVIPARRRAIIHNFIDTDLFSYREKPADHARKILWVRSAHSRKYGADIAVRCLKGLRDSGQWRTFDVRIIGDGEHFEEFEREFGRDRQVRIERRFASQTEIAALHKEYGLLLVPTRYDSQGVSRDEAMSSGLVPVTNAVAAVPEFVDDDCAILAGPEESDPMVEGILRVASDPALFSSMSANAARRARRQCGAAATVEREAELLGMLEKEPLPW